MQNNGPKVGSVFGLALCTNIWALTYHFCETEGAIQQEALSSTSQQNLMSDHSAVQNLPVKQSRLNELPYQPQPARTHFD